MIHAQTHMILACVKPFSIHSCTNSLSSSSSSSSSPLSLVVAQARRLTVRTRLRCAPSSLTSIRNVGRPSRRRSSGSGSSTGKDYSGIRLEDHSRCLFFVGAIYSIIDMIHVHYQFIKFYSTYSCSA